MARTHPAASAAALAFLLPFLSFTLPAPAHAADTAESAGAGGAVTGTGRATISRQPQVLRAQFVVTAEAKDVAGAVAKLKEAQAAASRKLAELGAADKSVEVGPTQMGAGPGDPRSQYAQYVQEMQRMVTQPGGGPKAPAKPQIVIVSSTVKAEWPLTAATADELFVAGYTLQDKIKAAGIGKQDLKKLTPEEAEAAEEAMGGKGGAGEPAFQYACKVSDADRASARAEAFQKAKADAADMARAAGTELAALRHVTAQSASPTAAESPDQAMARAMMQQVSGAATSTAPEAPPDEATAPAPTPVTLQITVTASFSVK